MKKLIVTSLWCFSLHAIDELPLIQATYQLPHQALCHIDRFLKQHAICKENGECFDIVHHGLDAGDNAGATALHTAARLNNSEVIEFLLEQGLDINAQDKNGRTPFHYAVQYNSLAAAKALLKHYANPNIKDVSDATPLYNALENVAHCTDAEEMAEYLIKKKQAFKNIICRGNSLLHLVIELDLNNKWVDLLIQNGANPELVNADHKTPLECAIIKSDSLAGEELKEHQEVIARLKYYKEYPHRVTL